MTNIIDVLAACAAASGRAFVAPARGGVRKLTLCPLHDDSSPSFSVSEDKAVWHCFGCGIGSGLIGTPVAFGLVDSTSEAARWLEARNLIPPSNGARTVATMPIVARSYTNPDEYSELERHNRLLSLVDIAATVGYLRLRAGRDFIAAWRARREATFHVLCDDLFELMLIDFYGGDDTAVARAMDVAPQLYTKPIYDRFREGASA